MQHNLVDTELALYAVGMLVFLSDSNLGLTITLLTVVIGRFFDLYDRRQVAKRLHEKVAMDAQLLRNHTDLQSSIIRNEIAINTELTKENGAKLEGK